MLAATNEKSKDSLRKRHPVQLSVMTHSLDGLSFGTSRATQSGWPPWTSGDVATKSAESGTRHFKPNFLAKQASKDNRNGESRTSGGREEWR